MTDPVKVGQTQGAQGTQPQTSGQEVTSGLAKLRNGALGVAAAGGVAMAAEAAGVITLPAAIPTGIVTAGALVTAGAAHGMLKLGEWMDGLTTQRDKALEQAGK